jgi:hypothetical protein
MNFVQVQKFPGEALFADLKPGDFFYLCDGTGAPRIWVKGTHVAIRLMDGKQCAFGDGETFVTKVPDKTEITVIVGDRDE